MEGPQTVTKRRSLDPPGRTDPGLVCLEAQALLGGLTRAWSALEAWALLGGLAWACSALEARALLGGLTRAWSALEAWALLGGLTRACSALEARALPGACRVLCASCSTESHCVNRE